MRYNKQELESLANLSPNKYEKQGLLSFREKSDGFFRRSYSFTERWCRLTGNLLFYLKTKNHWSEPLGVVVLEYCTFNEIDPDPNFTGYLFVISFGDNSTTVLSAASDCERKSWLSAFQNAGFFAMKAKLSQLRLEIQTKLLHADSTICKPKDACAVRGSGRVDDVAECPIFVITMSCDNLKCDSHGRSPNSRVVVHARNPPFTQWTKYASSEIIETNSNPQFLCTVTFRESDGLSIDQSELLFTVYNVRERTSGTQTLIGQVSTTLAVLCAADRVRLTLDSTHDTQAGFLTVVVYHLGKDEGGSTESTPCRTSVCQPKAYGYSHRRTQSLPSKFVAKQNFTVQTSVRYLFNNPFLQTYRFHSGLGGEIFVQEIMAESKYSFSLPLQLLRVWAGEEKELLQEMIGLGELTEPWHSKQVDLMEKHMSIVNLYNQRIQQLEQYKDNFKPSAMKDSDKVEFVPVNLHLQRIWAQNDSLHKSGFHDLITVGAFTAYSLGYEQNGLSKMIEEWKGTGENKVVNKSSFFIPSKVLLTADCIQKIKVLRKEIVERLQLIVKVAKEHKIQEMNRYVGEIYQRCGNLLHICEESLIEEALEFFEEKKLTQSPSLERFSTYDDSLDDELETPSSPIHSFSELVRRKKKEQSHNITPDSGVGLEEMIGSFLDAPSSNYYRPSEEPEPWELTQLNIQASVISLKSKIGVLASVAGSRVQNNTQTTDIAGHNSAQIHNNNNNDSSSFEELDNVDWSEELKASAKKLRLAMDGLLKTCRLAHSIFRLQEDDAKSQLGFVIKYRRDICFSHSLTTLVTALMTRLWCRPVEIGFLYVLTRLGPLVSFISLLTYRLQEAEMFGDMLVAINDLRSVEFVLVRDESKETSTTLPAVKIQGCRMRLKVLLPVPQSVFAMLCGPKSFMVTPVFFNIGINEQASIAHRLGNLEAQEKCNLNNFVQLNEYYRRFKKLTIPLSNAAKRGSNSVLDSNLDTLVDQMHREILSKKQKNVEVLHLCAQITRRLLGLRCTSCKSGKDRTSMSATLEQCHVLREEYDLSEHEFEFALEAMRSEGCRRENTLKNIGQRKYAFNSFQRMTLPKLYRPPKGSFGSVAT